jgi:hypothetical protein
MALSLLRDILTFHSPSTPATAKADKHTINNPSLLPKLERRDATDPSTTTELLVSIIERDGGVIVENLISQELSTRIKSDLKPYFDTDRVDPSGFFPHTT